MTLKHTAIHLELTNRCGYRCWMCPRDSMRRALGRMSVEDFDIIIERVGPFCGDVHLHGFGEALLDPDLLGKVLRLRQAWPRCSPGIITTLGVRMRKDALRHLLAAGLHSIQVSFLGYTRNAYRALHGVDRYELAMENLENLVKLRSEYADLSLSVRMEAQGGFAPTGGCSENETARLAFEAWLETVQVPYLKPSLHNFGRGRTYFGVQTELPCSAVWGVMRKTLQVSWNLNVIPCCLMFDDDIVFGNLREQTIAQIFDSEAYHRFVEAHMSNELDAYPACRNCERHLWGEFSERQEVLLSSIRRAVTAARISGKLSILAGTSETLAGLTDQNGIPPEVQTAELATLPEFLVAQTQLLDRKPAVLLVSPPGEQLVRALTILGIKPTNLFFEGAFYDSSDRKRGLPPIPD
ncbi:MAG TPA: SPASM domain-containing protein [Bryobacteraceae bacterium]|nr:SPASM domain-containing protein [Bryobacteraceae bacterium]